MKGSVHLIAGVAVGISAIYFEMGSEISLMPILAGAFAGRFGALLPDIDVETSTISRTHKKLSKIICKIFKHRGIMHSLLIPVIMSVLLYVSAIYYPLPKIIFGLLLSFTAGYCIHIIQDMCTLGGICLFYPIPIKIRLYTLRYGAKTELPATILIVLIAIQVLSFIMTKQLVTIN